jgi:DNA-binding response OmpR family regulator
VATTSGSVLLVEDNVAHAVMIRRAFKMARLQVNLTAVESGEEAIAYIKAAQTSAAAHALPDLVLLDWNLPGTSGLDVLRWIRNEFTAKALPVVVLTVSSDESDVSDAMLAGADSYLVKPVAFGLLVDLVELLDLKWLRPAARGD